MRKKERERLTKRLQGQVDRLTPSALSPEEVTEALRDAGCDVDRLRERLNQTARDLANVQRAKGKPAPAYLQEVADLTSPPTALPKNASNALHKAKQWIKGFTMPPTTVSGMPQIARAYRKTGDLSSKDERLLDSIEAELRRETQNK